MSKFAVNDMVKGISMKYGVTNIYMERARVLEINGENIRIRVLSHSINASWIGETFVVEEDYFKKIGIVKDFNREEVLDLIAKGNQDKLKEYDLYGANLSGADLSGANLSGADLSGADLRSANLSGADLRSADLRSANLSGADLRSADLRSANLRSANLRSANLSGANLSGANLSGADLRSVYYNEYTSFFALQCPEEGAFIAYKKASCLIVKLRVTEDASRSSATSRKCRCSKAEVLSITNLDGTDSGKTEVESDYDCTFVYRVGETVEVKNFDSDRWNECSTGIHFFVTRQEAVNYC